jgi:hypothetical protein
MGTSIHYHMDAKGRQRIFDEQVPMKMYERVQSTLLA